MGIVLHIPVIPLAILPLPGELVPIHIFEPKYIQLMGDILKTDASFGIYCNHPVNVEGVGSLVRLESVIKRYPNGEADVVVKCEDIFDTVQYFDEYNDKMYAGAEVTLREINPLETPPYTVDQIFKGFLQSRSFNQQAVYTIYHLVQALKLDIHDRYKFLHFDAEQRERFLMSRVNYHIHLLTSEEKSKDVYHLN
jgi:hypothetical protein